MEQLEDIRLLSVMFMDGVGGGPREVSRAGRGAAFGLEE